MLTLTAYRPMGGVGRAGTAILVGTVGGVNGSAFAMKVWSNKSGDISLCCPWNKAF
jgi:hypothetical protein